MPSKKQSAMVPATTAGIPRTAGNWEITEIDRAAAAQLGIDLEGSPAGCMARAARAANDAALRAVEAGYLLLRVKGEAAHGEFDAALDEIGMSSQRASEFMRMARFATLMPEAQRNSLITIGKSKVLALASADPEVIDMIIEEGADALDGLSVRDLRQHIKDMEAALADKDVQLETAQAQAEAAKKAAKRERTSAMPLEVEDIRAEIAAAHEKARQCLLDLEELTDQTWALMSASDDVAEYSEPTARLALGGLLSMHVAIDGLVKAMHARWHMGDASAMPLSHFTPDEILSAAREFPNLLAIHQHEKALREWEREQARPRGKGRPAAKPEAPKKSA